MTLRKVFMLALKTIGVLLSLPILYLLIALGFSYISVNSSFKECEKDAVEIYILTNGVHTDIVLPIKNQYKDWSTFVKPSDTRSGNKLVNNVAFGWGDKGFYLQTKTWADLKFSTAFNAAFYLSSSAMHITFYNGLSESETCKRVCIDKGEYMKLVDYIDKSFEHDSFGNAVQIQGASYWNNDSFYEAKGSYGLFNTCNTWANGGLKAAGLKACLWTPFDKGIFHQY